MYSLQLRNWNNYFFYCRNVALALGNFPLFTPVLVLLAERQTLTYPMHSAIAATEQQCWILNQYVEGGLAFYHWQTLHQFFLQLLLGTTHISSQTLHVIALTGLIVNRPETTPAATGFSISMSLILQSMTLTEFNITRQNQLRQVKSVFNHQIQCGCLLPGERFM
jgi:hypothetical protein